MVKRTVFVISPIGSPGTVEHRSYWLMLEYIVKKAFAGDEWEVVRADEETSPDSITTQVIGRIVESDIIIADLTDHNPNVFYELAVAHGYQKPVIHLIKDGQKVPFDVVDQRVIFYDLADPESVDKAREALRASVKWLDNNPGQSRNPLSAYEQFSAISSASGGGDAGEVVANALERLTRQVSRMEARLPLARPRVPRSRDEEFSVRLNNLRHQRNLLKERHAVLKEMGEDLRTLELEREMNTLMQEEEELLHSLHYGTAPGESRLRSE